MFAAVGHEVLPLRRCRFGPLELDPALGEGHWRELLPEELEALREAARMP
jgi:16S rRNA U516 pseudouridylate synthase RsuA-like enzyme